MGRHPKQTTPTPTEHLTKCDNLKDYELFMVNVNRSTNKKGDSVTKSVEIGKKLRGDIKIGEDSAELQNNLQDWQNKSAMGAIMIQWLFPKDAVRSGLEYAAKEEKVKDEDGDETNHKCLVIDTNNCLSHQ